MSSTSSSSSSSSPPGAGIVSLGPPRVPAACGIPEIWETCLHYLNIQELTKVSSLSLQMLEFCAPQDVWECCLANLSVKPTKQVYEVYGHLKLFARDVWYVTRNVGVYVESVNAGLDSGSELRIPLLHDRVLQFNALLNFIKNHVTKSKCDILLPYFIKDGLTSGIDAVLEGRQVFEVNHAIQLATLVEQRTAINAALAAARVANDAEGEQLHQQNLDQINEQITDIERNFTAERANYIVALKRALEQAIIQNDVVSVAKLWNELTRCGDPVIHTNPQHYDCLFAVERDCLIKAAKADPKILEFIISRISENHPVLRHACEEASLNGDFRAAWTLLRYDNTDYGRVYQKILVVAKSSRFSSHDEQYILFSELFRQLNTFGINRTGFHILFYSITSTPALANPLIMEFFLTHKFMEKKQLVILENARDLALNKGKGGLYSDESLLVFIQNLEPFKTCLARAEPALKERLEELLAVQNWPTLLKIAEQNPTLTDPIKLAELIINELRTQMVANCCSSNVDTVRAYFSSEIRAWMQDCDYEIAYQTVERNESLSSQKKEILEKITKLRASFNSSKMERGFLKAVREGNKERFAYYFKSIETMRPSVIREAYIASLKWMDNEIEIQLRRYVPDARALFIEHRRMR